MCDHDVDNISVHKTRPLVRDCYGGAKAKQAMVLSPLAEGSF